MSFSKMVGIIPCRLIGAGGVKLSVLIEPHEGERCE